MLFAHTLLFLLLGTSAVALPVDHGQHSPNRAPHSPLPGDHGPHSLVQDPDKMLDQAQAIHKHLYVSGINLSTVAAGKELEPGHVPPSLYHLLKIKSPQPTLILENIVKYAGVWYREPTNDVYYDNRNDIMEILLDDIKHEGIIVFHTMAEQPGQVIREYILLTSQNRHRLVGTWSRMPFTLPKNFHLNKMMVWETNDQLHYCVARHRLEMPSFSQTSHCMDLAPHSSPSPVFWGNWVREPEEDTPEEYANDVALIWPHSNALYTWGPYPGHQYQKQNFLLERFVGTWYRMPAAATEVKDRLDQMVLGMTDGKLNCNIIRHAVTMINSPER